MSRGVKNRSTFFHFKHIFKMQIYIEAYRQILCKYHMFVYHAHRFLPGGRMGYGLWGLHVVCCRYLVLKFDIPMGRLLKAQSWKLKNFFHYYLNELHWCENRAKQLRQFFEERFQGERCVAMATPVGLTDSTGVDCAFNKNIKRKNHFQLYNSIIWQWAQRTLCDLKENIDL